MSISEISQLGTRKNNESGACTAMTGKVQWPSFNRAIAGQIAFPWLKVSNSSISTDRRGLLSCVGALQSFLPLC